MRRSTNWQADVRGSFGELWRASVYSDSPRAAFVQANLSRSNTNALRGMHFHLRQTDLWILLEGTAHVCLLDLRDRIAGGSAPNERIAETFGPGDAVLIPEGVAHGFRALEPVSLLYLVTSEYDGTDERGFAWNDPEAGLDWPVGGPILSERDSAAPTLREAVAAAQRSGQISAR